MLVAEWPTLEWTMAVYQDPSGRKGKVIPILKRDCEIPPSLRIRSILDFRTPEKHERSYTRLLAVLKNEPLPRGDPSSEIASTASSPEFLAKPLEFADEIQETIASNIFPVRSFPQSIWSAETNVQSYREVYHHLRNISATETLPTFILRGNRIYTFYNLHDPRSPFSGLIPPLGIVDREDAARWLIEGSRQNDLIELLNRALNHNCESLGLFHDREHNRTYFLTDIGRDRIIEWDTGLRKSRRTVVKRYQRGPNGEIFWAHQSVVLRFMVIGSRVFLRMEPGWTFTRDGVTSLPRNEIGSISTRWMHDEYNPSIFYHLRFWTFVLAQARKHIVLDSGQSSIYVDSTPVTASMSVGIDGDHLNLTRLYEVAEGETPPVDYLLTNSDDRSGQEQPPSQEQQ